MVRFFFFLSGFCLIAQISESQKGGRFERHMNLMSSPGIVFYTKHQIYFLAQAINQTYMLLKLLLSLTEKGHYVCFIYPFSLGLVLFINSYALYNIQ